MTTVSHNYQRKLLTIPALSLKENEPRILRFDSLMKIGKVMKAQEGKKQMEPATIASVTDMNTGEIFELIVPAVLQSVLHENFPNDDYVGRVFELEALPKREGKQYRGIKAHLMESVSPAAPTDAHPVETKVSHKK